MGNICRSPAGEAVLRHASEAAGVELVVESAGTHGYHVGEPADERMRRAASARGYSLSSRARKVEDLDLDGDRYDLVVAMDSANHSILLNLATGGTSHIRLFSDFLEDSWPVDVPDPYYGGVQGFETVLNMLEAGCPAILRVLEDDVSP